MPNNKLLPILLPCVFFWMIKRNLVGLICLGLQITLIGWIPAALWAVQVQRQASKASIESEGEGEAGPEELE